MDSRSNDGVNNTHARFSKNYAPWMSHLQIGDVLRAGRRSLRVVRHLSRYKSGPKKGLLRSVTLTIKHCSWTGRCTTTLTYTDLWQRGFRPTGARRRLRSKLDRLIADDAGNKHTRHLDCCDVRGIS